MLTGSLGAVGGVNLHVTNKFVPKHPNPPPPPDYWNELLFPKEFPLAFFEMSFLLPHFLKEGRGKLDVYFTRVYNPLWTNPDGFSWMEVLQDKEKIGLHVALTPTWSETAWFADYILPMGLGTERHDTMSQETHAGQWLGFRQPVLRVAREKRGETDQRDATKRIPARCGKRPSSGSRSAGRSIPTARSASASSSSRRTGPASRSRWTSTTAGCSRTRCPACRRRPRRRTSRRSQYMRKYGVFQVSDKTYSRGHERRSTRRRDRQPASHGVVVDGVPLRRLQHAVAPARVLLADDRRLGLAGARGAALRARARALARPRSATRGVRPAAELPAADADPHALAGEVALRDLAQQPAVDLDRRTRAGYGIATGDLVKVRTRIGYFVTRAWVTEGIRPGVLGMSHHLGRWRLNEDTGGPRVASALVTITPRAGGRYVMQQVHGAQPFESNDPDSGRIWWSEVGVHQNLTFPVQPDPVSGMHCWHQRVRLEKAGAGRSLRRHRRRHGRGARGV